MGHINDIKSRSPNLLPLPKDPVPDRIDLPGRASSVFRKFRRSFAQLRNSLNTHVHKHILKVTESQGINVHSSVEVYIYTQSRARKYLYIRHQDEEENLQKAARIHT